MWKVFETILVSLLLLGVFPVSAQKKAKVAFNWETLRPKKLSGNESMDTYILSCDTLWNRIQNYKESVTFFNVDTTWARDNESRQLIKVVRITDEKGNPRNFSRSIQQGMELILNGSGIVLDAASISLQTTSASLSLAENPLLAFSYAKCLKGGPSIVKLAYGEIRDIVNATKKQVYATQSMRKSQLEGSTDQAILLPQEEGELPDLEDIHDLSEMNLGSSDDEVDISEEELEAMELDIDLQEPKETKKE